jgi:translation initiation factor 3 subunit L
VIDEFIYQFNSFCTYRQRVAKKAQNEEEIQILRENPQTWGCYSVLNVLYSLIQRSQMNEQLAAIKAGQDPNEVAGEYGSRPLYRMLGYFSIIGLLRVHCLLGDFTLALKTLDDIELNKKAVFAKVMAAHFTT